MVVVPTNLFQNSITCFYIQKIMSVIAVVIVSECIFWLDYVSLHRKRQQNAYCGNWCFIKSFSHELM